MSNRKLAWAVCVAAVFSMTLALHATSRADAQRTTYFTFNRPVSLPGVALGSGTYTFEIVNPDTTADVVRVTSRDGSVIYFMGHTRPVARPRGLKFDERVSIGESAAGVAPPITAWYPLNEPTGHQFVYPRAR